MLLQRSVCLIKVCYRSLYSRDLMEMCEELDRKDAFVHDPA
jgi:hypothetical protein